MKKSVLLNLSLLSIGLTAAVNAGAQGTLASDAEVLGARFIVDAPAAIGGVKDFTFSSDPAGTPWGGSLSTPVQNVEVVKAVDSEACATLTNNVTGKWVLIYRGNCEFGVKAKNAQDKGAAGVIIWNHTPAELINMGAGAVGGSVTIPVTFISNEDGRAMTNQLSAGQQVFISITPWGFNNAHDLAIVPGTPAPPPGMAIPISQFDGTDIPQYRGYVGGYVANTGTSTEADVKLKATVNWTPLTGGTTEVHKDSAMATTFAPIDSIKYDLFSPNHFVLNPTGVGRYDFNYTVSANDADMYTADNSHSFSLNITPNAFSRGRINVQSQTPLVTNHFRLSDGTASLTWGPLFYVKKGGYHMSHVHFSVADQDTSDHDLTGSNDGSVEVFVFKWVDGSNGGASDNSIQSEELTIKGIAVKKFTTLDSNKTMLAAYIGDATSGNPATIVSEDNSYYWFAANLNNVFGLSTDANANYHARTNAAMNFATSKTPDYWSPAFTGAATDLTQGGRTVRMFPFGTSSSDIDTLPVTQGSAVPAMTFIQGVFVVDVKQTAKGSADQFTVYPNPAVANVTAKIGLVAATEKLQVKIIDGVGRQVYSEVRKNVQNTEVSIPVSNLPAGNYYMIMISDNNAMARPFTVVGK
ncbi:MAG: hypothetical protein K0R82_1201 [Flavipsychrobacter sp.]|jgi:hypothetical protein|nr:hypothetical protein [Flavipsychrobacter sp.]